MNKSEPKTPKSRTKAVMDKLRADIDRVDTALLNLIAERMGLAAAVRQAKSGANVWRPSREESHVRDLAKKANGVSPELVSHIWAELTSASLTLQGPIGLHIALSCGGGGDALSQWSLVRDRFGASIPAHTYPMASGALATAHADLEGVAVLPAPGGMNNWWTALGPNGACADMNILAALPRIGAWDWPVAVAVSKAVREPSGDDITLLYIEAGTLPASLTLEQMFAGAGFNAVRRAEVDGQYLYSVAGYVDDEDVRLKAIRSQLASLKIVGVLPCPIVLPIGGEVSDV
ncbi:MAG: chorismate mutase [Robiginitomaculum sp.]|nr:chorismate mutase [Robiginitomaculum sp.]